MLKALESFILLLFDVSVMNAPILSLDIFLGTITLESDT